MGCRGEDVWPVENHDPHTNEQNTNPSQPAGGKGTDPAALPAPPAQTAVRWSENTLHNLFQHLPDLILVIDSQARVRFTNAKSRHAAPEHVLGTIGLDHLAPESRDQARQLVAQVFATGGVQRIEVRTVYDEWWDCRLMPLSADEVMIICSEATTRKRAEQRVASEQKLLRKLLIIQEQERKLISYEIHDELLQDVLGAHMFLEAAQAAWQRQGLPVPAELASVAELLDRAATEGRRMIGRLRPTLIDERGLLEAIEYLVAQETQTYGLTIALRHCGPLDHLPAVLERSLFRIVQEAVTNIRRHSQSTTAKIDLQSDQHRLVLEIRDTGVGFDPARVPPERFGLRGIVERARLFGGQATIASRPGEGTCVRVEMSLDDSLYQDEQDLR
jgi:signal transduction histidine kinase